MVSHINLVEQLRARGILALTDREDRGIRELSLVTEKSRHQIGNLEGYGHDLLLRITNESIPIYLSVVGGMGLGPLWIGCSEEIALDRLEAAFAVLDDSPDDLPLNKTHEHLRRLLTPQPPA